MSISETAGIIFIEPVLMLTVILVHELGHLAGGLISGHRFEFIRILNLSIISFQDEGLCLKLTSLREIGGSLGQCILTEKSASGNLKHRVTASSCMILGGGAANLLCGLVCLVFTANTFISVSFICLNMLVFLLSFFGGGNFDGDTLKEIKLHPERVELYYRLMLIGAALERGERLDSLPEELFTAGTEWDLYAEADDTETGSSESDNAESQYTMLSEIRHLAEVRRKEE